MTILLTLAVLSAAALAAWGLTMRRRMTALGLKVDEHVEAAKSQVVEIQRLQRMQQDLKESEVFSRAVLRPPRPA